MQRLLRLAFWLAILLTLYFTLRPLTIIVPGSDKTHHLITFGILVLIGGLAYPRARLLPLGIALSGLGALIELAQPTFGRSRDVLDWAADTAGILIALLIVAAVRRLSLRDRKSAP